MRRVLTAVLVLGLMWLWTAPARAVRVKMGTLAPKGSPWHTLLRDMAEGWKEVSGGKVRVRIYAGGLAGDEPDMVRKMKIGQLHAAALTGAGLARISHMFQGLMIPMMLRSQGELEYVRQRITPALETELERRGFKFLTWGDAGWVYFFTQKPVVHPDDLKPMRLFAWAGATAHIDGWKAMGYHPVALASTEIHTALQSGLINAFNTTPVAALSFQWFGQAKHMTDLKWSPLVGAVVITTRAWRRFDAGTQAKMLVMARRAGKRLKDMLPRFSREAVNVMKQHGLQVHTVPPDIRDIWERRAEKGWPFMIGPLVSADTMEEVLKYRDAFRNNRTSRN